MARKSFRMKFMFWLDVTKRGEDELIGQIEDSKAGTPLCQDYSRRNPVDLRPQGRAN